MIKETLLEKEYFNDLNQIKDTIRQNQNKAMIVVNSLMIMTYYKIGEIINQRKTWGSKYIQRLSNDLKEYGKGYSTRNLVYMSKFSNEFSRDEIMHQAGAQIPWRSLIEIMQKSKSHEEMLWYINQTHKNGWSRSMVLNKIAMKAYERSLIAPITTDILKSDEMINELYKDVIEVNINEFKPADLGELTFYVNIVDDLEKTELDNDTIGILLCKDADTYVARTSLNKNQLKLGISKYKFIEELPEYLERRLKEKNE